ncbi:unnamed protein product, partial [Rotaria magnacalcarata]
MVDYICELCKNKFCLSHFVDHIEEQKCSSNCRVELPPLLQPIATSTPVHTAQYHSSLRQQMADNENHVHTNRLTELNNSKVNNEANFNMKPEEP